MFRALAAEPTRDDVRESGKELPLSTAELIPLSYFALDFGGVPSEGCALFLGKKGIAFRPDFLGRDSITAGDAGGRCQPCPISPRMTLQSG
jgi:hypothetical protein